MKNNRLSAIIISAAITAANTVGAYGSAAMISDRDSENYKNKIQNLNDTWTAAEDLNDILSDVLKCGNNSYIRNVKNAWYKENDNEFAVYTVEQSVDDSYSFNINLADIEPEKFMDEFQKKVGYNDKMEYSTFKYPDNTALSVDCVFKSDNHELNYMISEKAYTLLKEMASVTYFYAGFDRSEFNQVNMNCYVAVYDNMKKTEYDSVYDLVDHEMLMEKYGAVYNRKTRKIEFPKDITEKKKLECYKYFTDTFDGIISSEYIMSATEPTTIDFKNIDIPYIDKDSNCDSTVDMSDAVLIMQSIANPSKYKLTAQGSFNADTDGDGITNTDALAIQKKLLKLE